MAGHRRGAPRRRWTCARTGSPSTSDGSFLIANLGDDGGIWRLDRSGLLTPVVREVDGVPLPPANFVTIDEQDRIWISVSTRLFPRQQAWRSDVADGFVVLAGRHGPRIVADGLHYTNEVRPDPTGAWLYIVETFGRRVSRFPIGPRGSLGTRETVFSMNDGFFPDGFAFDEDGGLWVTSLVSNRLVRFHRDRMEIVLEDVNADFVERVEQAFASRSMAAEHLGQDSRNADAATHERGIRRAGSPDRLSGLAARVLLVPLSRERQRRTDAALDMIPEQCQSQPPTSTKLSHRVAVDSQLSVFHRVRRLPWRWTLDVGVTEAPNRV